MKNKEKEQEQEKKAPDIKAPTEKEPKEEKNPDKEKILALENEIKKLNNDILLVKADMQNYRKRKDEESANLLKYANQDLMLELIPIMDNFERAIKLDDNNLTDELSKFLAGFKMMYAQLVEIMKKFGLEEIDALGKPFDHSCMEALMLNNDPSKEDNIVLDVLMKGYRLKDRVIRPCTVKVNQKEEEKKENIEENKGDDKNE